MYFFLALIQPRVDEAHMVVVVFLIVTGDPVLHGYDLLVRCWITEKSLSPHTLTLFVAQHLVVERWKLDSPTPNADVGFIERLER